MKDKVLADASLPAYLKRQLDRFESWDEDEVLFLDNTAHYGGTHLIGFRYDFRGNLIIFGTPA